jgi:ankyrin repeat protein
MAEEQVDDHYAIELDACLEASNTDTDEVFSPSVDSPDGGVALPVSSTHAAVIKESMTRSESGLSTISQATSGDASDLPSPIQLAIEDFDIKGIDGMLTNGVDVKDIGHKGMNAGHYLLHCYCKLHPADQVEIKPKLNEILQMLIKYGLDLNVGEPKRKQRPLHIAASYPGNGDVIKPLLASGAKVNLPDGQLKTALHHAVSIADEDNCNALIEGGANPNLQDNLKQTVLHIAAKGRRNVTLVQFLLSCGAESNIQDVGARTALHVAAKSARSDLVKELLNYGAHVNLVDSSGQTAMHLSSVYDITGWYDYIIVTRRKERINRGQVGTNTLKLSIAYERQNPEDTLCMSRYLTIRLTHLNINQSIFQGNLCMSCCQDLLMSMFVRRCKVTLLSTRPSTSSHWTTSKYSAEQEQTQIVRIF